MLTFLSIDSAVGSLISEWDSSCMLLPNCRGMHFKLNALCTSLHHFNMNGCCIMLLFQCDENLS